MAVIAVIQQKGGVGKTTITANVAGELVKKGRAVKILDLDPQQSLVIWAQLGSGVLRDIVEPVSIEDPCSMSPCAGKRTDPRIGPSRQSSGKQSQLTWVQNSQGTGRAAPPMPLPI